MSKVQTEAAARTTTRRRLSWAALLLVPVIAAGVVLTVAATVAPQWANEKIMDASTAVETGYRELTGDVPTIRLGPEGGERELDWCSGEFIELAEYRDPAQPDLPPTFVAHNLCDGKVVLTLEEGMQVDVVDRSGAVTRHTVSERRTVPPNTPAREAIAGMRGALVLQTCNWNWDIRLIALTPQQ